LTISVLLNLSKDMQWKHLIHLLQNK